MAEQQPTSSGQRSAQSTFVVDVPGEMVGGSGNIAVEVPTNTPPNMMREIALQMAREQVQRNSLAVRGPQAGQQFGVQMPNVTSGEYEGFDDAMAQAMASAPQALSMLLQLIPQVRAFGLGASAGIPAAARVATNLAEDKPLSEGVLTEALLGGALHVPQFLGEAAHDYAPTLARHTLAKSPRIGDLAEQHGKAFVERELPAMALARRAAPTRRGVATATDRAVEMTGEAQDAMRNARTMLDGIPNPTRGELAMQTEAADAARLMRTGADKEHALANVLEDLRFGHSMRGSPGGVSALIPGSGPVTAVSRAAGVPSSIGQLAAPAVGIVKGSPARRMAIARNLHRPGNVVDADDLGYGLSQILRAIAAASMEPVASHERRGEGGGTAPSRVPRRRGQQ